MTYGYLTPTNGFTVELWFNHAAIPTWQEHLINQQGQSTSVAHSDPSINQRQFAAWLATGDGALTIEFVNSDGVTIHQWTDPSPSGYPDDGEWHHFAMRLRKDAQTVDVYLDGQEKYFVALSEAMDWGPGSLVFGGAYAPHLGNWGAFLYKGGLAYAAAYDTMLSENRIFEHYTAGNGGTSFYGDDEVTRLERIYGYAGVPAASRRYDDPVTTLQGLQVAQQNALTKVKETAHAVSGVVFADGQSTMVYQNRRHRYNRPVSIVLSESNGSAPNVGMEFSTDETKVYNDIRARRPFGGSARVRNKASEYEYGQHVHELELPLTSDEEMRNAASWIAERYGEDRLRVSGVTLSAESSEDIQHLAETIELGDVIAFDELPENVPTSYMDFVVEGISVNADFKNHTWALGLDLSPADLWKVLQVGTSTVGDGSRVAY